MADLNIDRQPVNALYAVEHRFAVQRRGRWTVNIRSSTVASISRATTASAIISVACGDDVHAQHLAVLCIRHDFHKTFVRATMLAFEFAEKGNLPIFTSRPACRAAASVMPTLEICGSQ